MFISTICVCFWNSGTPMKSTNAAFYYKLVIMETRLKICGMKTQKRTCTRNTAYRRQCFQYNYVEGTRTLPGPLDSFWLYFKVDCSPKDQTITLADSLQKKTCRHSALPFYLNRLWPCLLSIYTITARKTVPLWSNLLPPRLQTPLQHPHEVYGGLKGDFFSFFFPQLFLLLLTG